MSLNDSACRACLIIGGLFLLFNLQIIYGFFTYKYIHLCVCVCVCVCVSLHRNPGPLKTGSWFCIMRINCNFGLDF